MATDRINATAKNIPVMMAGDGDSWKRCGVCDNDYDSLHHVPVFLPACGHTFCCPCLIKINNINEKLNCPICREPHCGTSPENLPKNRAVLDMLPPKSQRDEQHHTDKGAPKDPSPPSNPQSSKSKLHHTDKGAPKDPSPPSNPQSSKSKPPPKASKGWIYGLGIAAGIGFTSAGIAASSIASAMMSSAAIANGGGVAAGGLVAVLQSAGAAGIGLGANACIAGAGAAVGAGVGAVAAKVGDRNNHDNDDTSQSASVCKFDGIA
ncbi:Interferon alpha-inducible protein 27-like protein 1-like [Homarus americanus]|uniref:Interferon alpha-inducible protein 27-like protein 1-like n=1 Tax=Homarus americanus TaxID=6706 RepID=A0A8J5NEX2_HOMAM|nr:Interferon alpha-inducible protein 27-like protein 1-like [Homarus americanus]